MKIIQKIDELKAFIQCQKKIGKSIGFVPTMGYLHDGHMSLVKASKQENDITVMSIFVNPVQFGPKEDYSRYPRDLERDAKMAEAEGVDVIFYPTVEEMYPDGYKTYVQVEGITEVLCGKSRPGHFRGVATVVCKLFNIVEPDRAYFGQKDAQQVAVIQRMVKDLNMNLEVISCPIIRESDGLAMSSRNVYLTAEERRAALILNKSIQEAVQKVKAGERDAGKVLTMVKNRIETEPLAVIDYVELYEAETLQPIEIIQGKVLLAVAVKFGTTRLIDNAVVEV